MRTSVLLSLLVALCLPAVAGATELRAGEARATLQAAADSIEKQYFDASQGKSIADALRRFAASKAISRAQDPQVVAARATDFLQRYDGHFALLWAPEAEASAGPTISYKEWEAQQNYGFYDVRRLAGNIGYLDLRSFAMMEADDAGSPARRAADAAMRLLENTDAIILDLRNNGGGSSEMLAYLMAYFLPDKPFLIARFKLRSGPMEESWLPKIEGKRRTDIPLIILTSGRTPSAAESFIYGLQQADRAPVLIGERTAGEANPVAYIPVGKGFTAHVPFGTPVDPRTGSNWEKVGIVPGLAVAASQALQVGHASALKAVLTQKGQAADAVEARWALQDIEASKGVPPFDAPSLTGSFGSRQIRLEGASLIYTRKRWPPLKLRHLGDLRFSVESKPDLLISFKSRSGQISELHEISARGNVLVFPRDRN